MKNYLPFVILSSYTVLMSACISISDNPPDLGLDKDQQFKDCPDRPNCISSQAAADDDHYLEPWSYEGDSSQLMEKLKEVSGAVEEVKWLASEPSYLRGVFITPIMRYPDDIEFFYDSEKDLIHFRSASRFGYSDLGANKDRLLAIKAKFFGEAQAH